MAYSRSLYNFVLLFVLYLPFTSYAQQANKFDNLLQADKAHSKEDLTKLKIWLALAIEYKNRNVPEGLRIADKAVALAKRLNKQDELGTALRVRGLLLSQNGKQDSAIAILHSALEILNKTNNKKEISVAYWALGITYQKLHELQKAIMYDDKSIVMAVDSKCDECLVDTYSNLGSIYYDLSNLPKALEYFQKALIINKRVNNNTTNAARITQNMAVVYQDQGSLSQAVEGYLTSVGLNEKEKNLQGLAWNYNNLGTVYEYLVDYDKAVYYYAKARDISKQMGDIRIFFYSQSNIASIQYLKKDYVNALAAFNVCLSLADSLKNKVYVATMHNDIGSVYAAQENWNNAINEHEKAYRLYDSTDNPYFIENERAIAEDIMKSPDNILLKHYISPQQRYDTAYTLLNHAFLLAKENNEKDKLKEILLTSSQLDEKQGNIAKAFSEYKDYITLRDSLESDEVKKQVTRKGMQYEFDKRADSIHFRNQLTQSKLQQQALLIQQQLLLTNREKELQLANLLKTQADLKNEQLVANDEENKLALSEKEKQLQKENLLTISKNNALQKLQLKQWRIYGIGAFLLLAASTGFWYYRNKVKQAATKADLERRMSDATLTSLHTQMNPHFIFNCLGSIKHMILAGEQENANKYLNKFAKMIRLSLEHSRKSYITIQENLDYLNNYLEMECLRFDNSFTYKIETDRNIVPGEIAVPPMMIQPLVENAVWHGLLNKQGNRELAIRCRLQNEQLICEVEDNGIGINQSNSINKIAHRSFGIENIRKRLELLNQKYNTACALQIIDRSELNKNTTGTIAILTLPFLKPDV